MASDGGAARLTGSSTPRGEQREEQEERRCEMRLVLHLSRCSSHRRGPPCGLSLQACATCQPSCWRTSCSSGSTPAAAWRSSRPATRWRRLSWRTPPAGRCVCTHALPVTDHSTMQPCPRSSRSAGPHGAAMRCSGTWSCAAAAAATRSTHPDRPSQRPCARCPRPSACTPSASRWMAWTSRTWTWPPSACTTPPSGGTCATWASASAASRRAARQPGSTSLPAGPSPPCRRVWWWWG